MTEQEQLLWKRIQDFQLNDPESSFQFSQRLARENGWSKEYTQRVIEEYKKFIFLCCISPDGVTPSDPVDQVWHLHLTYTKSYWIDLCQNTLKNPIHHNPTKGGKGEEKKFNSYYDKTHERYLEKFKEKPPADIWHTSSIRFSRINFQRINLDDVWLIKKPSLLWKKKWSVFSLILASFLFVQAKTEGRIFIIILIMVAAVLLFLMMTDWLKPKGERRRGGDNSSGCGMSGCGGCSTHSSECGGGGSGCGGGD